MPVKSVRIIIGTNAYACIQHDTGSFDALLSAGRSASKSLRESAAEEKKKADRLLRNALLMEEAAHMLELQK